MPFYDNYILLCNKVGKSPSAVAVEIGLAKPAVTRWKNGGQPTDSTVAKLATYFGVTTDYLLGKENKKAPTGSGERAMSDEELKFALWGDCQDIDENDLEDVRRYAAFVRERKKAQK